MKDNQSRAVSSRLRRAGRRKGRRRGRGEERREEEEGREEKVETEGVKRSTVAE